MSVLDEMLKQRKILLVLKDDQVEQYINTDISDIDMTQSKDHYLKLDPVIRKAVEEKLEFRRKFAWQVGITKVNYMMKVLKEVFNKATIADPSTFREQLRSMRKIDKIQRQAMIQRQNSQTSSRSSFSKMTGTTQQTESELDV